MRPSFPITAPLVLLALAGASLLGTRPARADDFMAYVNGGAALPVHPAEFGDFWQTGWGVGGGFAIPIVPEWALAVQFQYQRHAADGAAQSDDLLLTGPGGIVTGVASIDGRDLTIVSFLGEFRFLAPTTDPSRTWFLAIGAGAVETSVSDARVTPVAPGLDPVIVLSESDTAFAASVGGGVEIDVSSTVRLTVDSIYTIGFTEGASTQFLPLRLGLAFRIR